MVCSQPPAATDYPLLKGNMNMPPRILIVDDNGDIRNLLDRYLSGEGYQTVMAKDGLDALHQIGQMRPDLVLLDIAMPRLDGWKSLIAIRRMSEGLSIPVIALTAHAMSTDRDRALQYGFNAFITKPLSFSTLLQTIDTLLHQGQPAT
jgi:CheY-like chemotaxis protein